VKKAKRKCRFWGASLLVSVGPWGGLHWHANRRWQRIVVGWVSIWFGAVDIDSLIFFQVPKREQLEELLAKVRADLAYEQSKASPTLNRMAANAHLN